MFTAPKNPIILILLLFAQRGDIRHKLFFLRPIPARRLLHRRRTRRWRTLRNHSFRRLNKGFGTHGPHPDERTYIRAHHICTSCGKYLPPRKTSRRLRLPCPDQNTRPISAPACLFQNPKGQSRALMRCIYILPALYHRLCLSKDMFQNACRAPAEGTVPECRFIVSLAFYSLSAPQEKTTVHPALRHAHHRP